MPVKRVSSNQGIGREYELILEPVEISAGFPAQDHSLNKVGRGVKRIIHEGLFNLGNVPVEISYHVAAVVVSHDTGQTGANPAIHCGFICCWALRMGG